MWRRKVLPGEFCDGKPPEGHTEQQADQALVLEYLKRREAPTPANEIAKALGWSNPARVTRAANKAPGMFVTWVEDPRRLKRSRITMVDLHYQIAKYLPSTIQWVTEISPVRNKECPRSTTRSVSLTLTT